MYGIGAGWFDITELAASASVSFHVKRQMVTSRKLTRAEMALERLGSSMLTIVTGQFI